MSSDPTAKGPRRNIRIGKYEVVSHIATGGMGAVYKARDTENDREVALKVMSPEMAAKPSMVERFRREARHAAKLRHENIVTVYDFGEANHTFYLAMEFVDGIDLHEYITRKGPLDPNEALDLILQAARALDHIDRQGIIHRDIKPSNYLVMRQDDRLVVKMTDLGLARKAENDEEFRVTRAGTTVGTLDYMAPEQARDSGLADIRSDLYSLGSTWYHLLTGHAPFPKGGLGERLNRILYEEPPNVRTLNPRVSETMAAVLHRLMAKKPSRRYQHPSELLRDLEALERGEPLLTPRELLAGLGEGEEERKTSPSRAIKKPRRSSDGRNTPRPPSGRFATDTAVARTTREDTAAGSRSHVWIAWVGVAALLLVIGLIVLFSLRRARRNEPLAEDNASSAPASILPPVLSPSTAPTPDRPAGHKENEHGLATEPHIKSTLPALYKSSQPVDVAALRKEIQAPWSGASAPTKPVELVVSRLLAGVSSRNYRSLAAACKAVPAGSTAVIELRDNGPFYDVPAVLADRSLVVRAAPGYHPLLVWDVRRTLDERRRNRDDSGPLVFLDVKHGDLSLEGIEVCLQWPEAPSEGTALLRVEDGNLDVANCTFSVAGKPRDGLALARFRATNAEGRRCRFQHCHARGAGLSMLDLDAPGAQVLLDNCLLVGGDTPLLQVKANTERTTHLRVVRSTMISDKNLLSVRPATERDHEPALDWLSWDVLLSRKGNESGGALLRLDDSVETRRMNWRAINCLYAGWEMLLAGKSSIPVADLPGWRRLWDRLDGDVARAEPWPTAVFPEPAEVSAATYRTASSAVAFASSIGADQPLGCDLDALPPALDNWLSLTFGRFAIVAAAIPDDPDPPEVPVATDNLYHGERLDLDRLDLGAYLQEVQRTHRLAPQVVLHLAGTGERLTTPLRIKGSSLVLYFEPPPEKSEPLALAPTGRGPEQALIEVEQGNLDILGGTLRLSDAAEARALPWLVKVSGGDVRLFRSRIEVPPRTGGGAFRALIRLDGSGDHSADRIRSCAVNETSLVSARDAIQVQGAGARVLLTQTLLIAGENGIRLALDPAKASSSSSVQTTFGYKANVQYLLDHATVSAREAVVFVPDFRSPRPLAEPVIVQTHHCSFLNLFGRTVRTSLMRYESEALARGYVLWQSDRDAFDRRIWFAATPASGALPDRPEERSSWLALWGTPALRRPVLDLNLFRTLDADRWSIDRLIGLKVPGADLERLGIGAKPMKKTSR
jgi:serine/threonine-protein kinase